MSKILGAGLVVFGNGYLAAHWGLLIPLAVGLLFLLAGLSMIPRIDARRVRREREDLGRRLNEVQQQLRNTGRRLQGILSQVVDGLASLPEHQANEIPRLMLNEDGSISEY